MTGLSVGSSMVPSDEESFAELLACKGEFGQLCIIAFVMFLMHYWMTCCRISISSCRYGYAAILVLLMLTIQMEVVLV